MKTITLADLKGILRARVTEAPSLRAAATPLAITPAWLSKLLTSTRPPGPKLLRTLGYRRVVLYERITKKGA